ncbi:01936752-6dfe-49bc-b73d-ed748d4cb26d [Sclerotinia trifoliorum]|uniref:01936752-6dfe-49bc-b73d-ed748d4cb26d n=1 Tax=Sclerotinia trifoliorum TaxID=28548 RepID=A0A8H2ZPZ5_9HELO|nr:01936752-6dfe-49bc-b73d-ed748d4cb26d [Sclerotinia trifoliorum]
MSRRPANPQAERIAQNTQTIKSLLKLECNKVCCDCKRNKHPRWASWNLGVFMCIRCSGIHRGMGTHISRVKSVDLDSWTDEQVQSVLKWGNARANKYWEAKLAPGHVPSEAKIENFIRTKYDSKRWVMDGPIPDPSTLDVDGDDDMPLGLVKEKHNLERSTSQRTAPPSKAPTPISAPPQQDLFGDDIGPPPRASTAGPVPARPPPKSEPAPPKQTKPADSLLGLDFFGTEAAPPNRPSSTAPAPGTQSRPDLKQSILSLYASTPRPQVQQQTSHISHASSGSFGGMQAAPQQSPQRSTFGGMNDAFSSLSFSNSTSPPAQSKPTAFSNLGNISSHRSAASGGQTSSPSLSGGGFFDTKPKAAPAPSQVSRTFSSSSGFGAFDSAPGQSPAPQSTNASSALGDLFDFSTPAVQSAAAPKQTIASPPIQPSVFNLSSATATSQKSPPAAPAMSNAWGNTDAWGSNDAWGSAAKISPSLPKPAPPQTSTGDFGGWGGLSNQSIVPGAGGSFNTIVSAPKVAADDEFGGWSSAAPAPAANATSGAGKPAGGFSSGGEDLFSNVWE